MLMCRFCVNEGNIMIADDFAKEYLGSFVIDEKTQLLHEIAKEYHNACDAYDSLVCDKNADGDFYPATDWQFVQINVHARLVLKRLLSNTQASLGLRFCVRFKTMRAPKGENMATKFKWIPLAKIANEPSKSGMYRLVCDRTLPHKSPDKQVQGTQNGDTL